MRDCPNAEMRDALPDLMHGTLPPDRLAVVRAHLDGCDACRAEVALLARVRDSVRTPTIATDRIVASLPAYRRQPSWRRITGRPAFRVAAAVVLLAGGASLVLRNGGRTAQRVGADSITRVVPVTELALGETFADVSDSALVALVESMADLEPLLSEDPETVAVPLLPAEGL